MGGAPVLFMIAAMGITYGWQPDDSGGVEYIVQVPAEELHELERIGEISSAIDPAVRGHVSRVVIRVGQAPLPKIAPRGLAVAGQRSTADESDSASLRSMVAAADHSPVPIPEMDDSERAIPISGVKSRSASRQAAMLKPDPEGSGFSLPPSLGGVASGAVDTLRGNVDAAGRDLSTRTTQQLDSLMGRAGNMLRDNTNEALGSRVAPPGTRMPDTNPQQRVNPNLQAQTRASGGFTVPQFTGNDPTGAFAKPRSGGPSTEPNQRSNAWHDFAGSRSEADTATPATASTPNHFGTSGLGPNDNFAKPPSGLSFPGRAGQDTAGQGYDPTARNTATRNTSPILSQYEQMLADRQAGLSDPPAYRQNDTQDPNNAFSQPMASGRSSSPAQPRTATGPDPRLTRAQVEAGAWSVDDYDRILDRRGFLMRDQRLEDAALTSVPSSPVLESQEPRYADSRNPPNPRYAQATPITQQPRYPFDARYAQSDPSRVAEPAWNGQRSYDPGPQTSLNSPLVAGSGQVSSFPASTNSRDSSGRTSRVDDDPRAGMSERDNQSLSDRPTQIANTPATAVGSPQPVAAQPLFNGLLLISVVANVYLIFWLKNLRVQFRDLVAAKRIANANSSAA